MSKEFAFAEALKLKGYLERYGVRTSIELQAGARIKYGWYCPSIQLEMSHHVASRRSQGLTPFLYLVKQGRKDVPGPLCNGYMGFEGVYRIITMGVSNSTGRGGPLHIANRTIPQDKGAYFFWSTEYEGGYDEADWPHEYRMLMGAANWAICQYLADRHKWKRDSTELHAEHSTWAPERKHDRLGYSRESGIQEMIAARSIFNDEPADIRSEYAKRYLTHTAVMRIQQILADTGNYTGYIDGVYGPMTTGAVRTYQLAQRYTPFNPRTADISLYVDGDWGPITERHYQYVKDLQHVLNKWKTDMPLLVIDGSYGRYTERRVQEWQRRNRHLYSGTLDGLAGPVTCDILDVSLT